MIGVAPPLKLLAFPGLLMGSIQIVFGILSAFVFDDNIAHLFVFPALASILISIILFTRSGRGGLDQIGIRESIFYVSYTWLVCGVLGAIPIQLIEHVSFTDSVFESISALTTTGATILSNLDDQPKSFLMYRQFLQWIGGLGVIIFVVAILPMLNIGGMKILRAETPGPIKDDKLAPRIANSAQYFWYIYLTITLLCCIGYVMAGMNWFDAIAHSFTTVSTGGFSTHDASIGYFNSSWVEVNADIFMLLGAISFSLHFRFFNSLSINTYAKDEETRSFIFLVLIFSVGLALILIANKQFDLFSENISKSIFMLISFITSTGFGEGDFTNWPPVTSLIFVFAAYLGGCSGSTAGGNKIIRNVISFKLFTKQIKQLIHPNGVFSIRYNGSIVNNDILSSTMVFLSISLIVSIFIALLLMSTGLDFWSAFSAVSACINVSGPAFGELSNNFQPVTDFGIWILSMTMLLGRLEFLTLLVIITPHFWKS